jgi:hypothetical protein
VTVADEATIDHEALLCALVLAPSTYSRNRFFSLYQDGELRAVRRRAAVVRSLVKQLSRAAIEPSVETLGEGAFELTVLDPVLCFKRRTRLDGLELALVRYMVARARGQTADREREHIEATLARLAGPMLATV